MVIKMTVKELRAALEKMPQDTEVMSIDERNQAKNIQKVGTAKKVGTNVGTNKFNAFVYID